MTYAYSYDNSLLLNTDKHGLFYYDEVADVVYNQYDQGFPFDAPDVKITSMYRDSNDNLWIGTYDQGYFVIYAYAEKFNNDSWLKSILANKSVLSVADDSKGKALSEADLGLRSSQSRRKEKATLVSGFCCAREKG